METAGSERDKRCLDCSWELSAPRAEQQTALGICSGSPRLGTLLCSAPGLPPAPLMPPRGTPGHGGTAGRAAAHRDPAACHVRCARSSSPHLPQAGHQSQGLEAQSHSRDYQSLNIERSFEAEGRNVSQLSLSKFTPRAESPSLLCEAEHLPLQKEPRSTQLLPFIHGNSFDTQFKRSGSRAPRVSLRTSIPANRRQPGSAERHGAAPARPCEGLARVGVFERDAKQVHQKQLEKGLSAFRLHLLGTWGESRKKKQQTKISKSFVRRLKIYRKRVKLPSQNFTGLYIK